MVVGRLHKSILINGQEASLRDKAGWDYTILIYHIRNIAIYRTSPRSHSGSGIDGETGEEAKGCMPTSLYFKETLFNDRRERTLIKGSGKYSLGWPINMVSDARPRCGLSSP